MSLQEERARASQQRRGQQLNNEAQQSGSLVAQLRAVVAEREARVRQLEVEVGQLRVRVSRAPGWASAHLQVLARPSNIQRNLSPFQSFHLPLLRLHRILPGPTLAPCFPQAPQPMQHPPFPSEVQT